MRVSCRNRLTKLVLFEMIFFCSFDPSDVCVVAMYILRVLTTRRTVKRLSFSHNSKMAPLRLRLRIQSYYVRESANSYTRV